MKIPQAVAAQMRAHAKEELPNECCGLLVGRRGFVQRAVRARNLEAGPTRYLIDPQDHFAAMRAARGEGLHVIGAYHSHPAGTTEPSPSDIAEASGGADFLCVIVSSVTGAMTGFLVKNGLVILTELAE